MGSLKAQHDSDILRRSLSRVTLKQRIEATRAISEKYNRDCSGPLNGEQSKRREHDAAPIYLAVST